MELLAIEGLTISHSTGSPVTGGTFTVVSTPSTKVKITGSGVYSGTLSFNFIGGTHSSGTPGTANGSGTINFTSTKVRADGQFVLRNTDTGTLNGTYIPPSTPPPTVPFSSGVEISDAGQNKVSGE